MTKGAWFYYKSTNHDVFFAGTGNVLYLYLNLGQKLIINCCQIGKFRHPFRAEHFFRDGTVRYGMVPVDHFDIVYKLPIGVPYVPIGTLF